MSSLFDELCKRIGSQPKLTKRKSAYFDLSMLLFNSREDIGSLWKAADLYLHEPTIQAQQALKEAVEKLRPIFGQQER
jgi:hypothetical protein